MGRERIDCIITGIHMSSEGLTAEERQQTYSGYLTGLVWLHNRVFIRNAGWKERVIIYENSDCLLKAESLIREKRLPISLEGLFIVEAIDEPQDPECLRKCGILPRLGVISRMGITEVEKI